MYNTSELGASADELKSILVALTEASFTAEEVSLNSSKVLLTTSQKLMNDVLNNRMELNYDQIGMVLEVLHTVAMAQEREKNL